LNNLFFSEILINWYIKHKRDLPWRQTRDPYRIWLSEIILQQTRVDQGRPYYERFVENYPNVSGLAEAGIDQVLKLWEGLGYYSRAKNLHKCARQIVREYNGIFPDSYDGLLQLPGIGPYSAAAIASFAYQEPVAVLDGNVYRVLSRVFGVEDDISQPKTAKVFRQLANELLDTDRPDLFNQAIMEYGAMLCKPKAPICESCVLSSKCYAYGHAAQSKLPLKSKKVKVTTRYFYYLVLEKEGKIAMTKRNDAGIWKGLYDFELIESKSQVEVEDLIMEWKNKGFKIQINESSREYKHILTHQRIYATFFRVTELNSSQPAKEINYYSMDEAEELAKPVLISKYLKENIF